FTVALSVLPTVIFFSSLMSVLYYVKVMQPIVRGIAWVMQRTMGTTGPETLCGAANVFLGMTEAPLVVKPYVDTMTRSELMAVMIGGFANVAGGVIAAYVGMLKDFFDGIAGHLITGSVMSAPAAFVISKVMLPETQRARDSGSAPEYPMEQTARNLLDAAA